jgi:FkbM family methyltransferase
MTNMRKLSSNSLTYILVVLGFLVGVSLRDFVGQFEKSNEKIETNFIHPDNKWKIQMHYNGIQQKQLSKSGFYSQVGQDVTLLSIFENKFDGFFVDLASNHAQLLSNTLALERHLGWQGLCIEPNPRYHAAYKERICTLVDAIAGKFDNEKISFVFDDALGGISGFDKTTTHNENGTKLQTVSLESIFKKMNVPTVINYMSLDVEGAELYVMSTFPFHKYRFDVITVERPRMLRVLLEKNDYVYVTDHGT